MNDKAVFLGVDVGSVSTNLVLVDQSEMVLQALYLKTRGEPVKAVQEGLAMLGEEFGEDLAVGGVGATGSGRQLSGVVVGADVVKNEITAHAVAALQRYPKVRTVIEIGGQDSKIILLRDGVVVDFAMNTVCAAGTGSFLDRQAARLGVPIEDFGGLALRSQHPVRIAGRCAVFAESDMIHKQQMGHTTEDITRGLCQALVRNFLNNVAKGKEVVPPIVFQGGVAANVGMKQAFEEALEGEVHVPNYFGVMGAIGAAMLAKEEMARTPRQSRFRGFGVSRTDFRTTSFECDGCSNHCEIIEIYLDAALAARWGGRCDRWERLDRRRAAEAASST
ncbi:MAG: acyl-CoA dehydratase activase [Bacillota bacterium]